MAKAPLTCSLLKQVGRFSPLGRTLDWSNCLPLILSSYPRLWSCVRRVLEKLSSAVLPRALTSHHIVHQQT